MGRRAALLIAVAAVAVSVVALGHAAASSKPLLVSLKFPKACTGVVYRFTVTPTGSPASVTVKNTAALPAEIRAVAATTQVGPKLHVWIFANNISVAVTPAIALPIAVGLVKETRPGKVANLAAQKVAFDLIANERVVRWSKLGNFASPPDKVAKFSAAPASDKSAHCG